MLVKSYVGVVKARVWECKGVVMKPNYAWYNAMGTPVVYAL